MGPGVAFLIGVGRATDRGHAEGDPAGPRSAARPRGAWTQCVHRHGAGQQEGCVCVCEAFFWISGERVEHLVHRRLVGGKPPRKRVV